MTPAEDVRARAEDALWVAYGMAARLADGSGASMAFIGPGPHVPPTGLESVDALEALGLLGAKDATVWRARIAAAVPQLRATPALRERLHAVLGAMTRATLAAGNGHDARERPQAVLNDLRNLGLLDDEETHWWFSLITPPRSVVDQPEPVQPVASLERFLRCVPGPAERRRGLRILSVDSFENATVVHAHLARGGRGADGRAARLRDEVEPDAPPLHELSGLTLEDDLGTTYRYCSGGGGGSGSGWSDGPLVFEYTHEFAVPIPARAAKLIVRHEEIAFVVAL